MHEFAYNYETLAHLSGFSPAHVRQSISRGELKAGDLRSAVIWLSTNGTPDLRAAIARRILPAVLGVTSNGRMDQKGLANIASSHDIMLQIFKRDTESRRSRANLVQVTKRAKAKKAS